MSTPDLKRGYLLGIAAYLVWGLFPLYFKMLETVPALEIVVHRALGAAMVGSLLLVLWKHPGWWRELIARPRLLALLGLSGLLIATNWLLYVWAVNNGRMLETSLGYYINPLVTVMIGAIFLGERFNRYQVVSIALAAVAIGVLTIAAGGLPWVSLSLAFTFAAYGYFRKTLPIGPSQGFFLEVLILGVPSIAYIVWLEATGQGSFFTSFENAAMLALSGPVTAVPLLLYAFGA